jgi:hypothetical protein
VNDDFDVDAVADPLDNCPVKSNPTTLPGSQPPVQADGDFNGVGDVCDPVGHFDANRDGIPDDVANGPFFAMATTCGAVPLADVAVLAAQVRDRAELGACPGGPTTRACTSGPDTGRSCTTLGATCAGGGVCADVTDACGDGDTFGDPGERVRFGLLIQNQGPTDLTGLTVSVYTSDPDVSCLLDTVIQIPLLAAGSVLDTRSLSPPDDPGVPTDGRFFEAVISPTATTTASMQPARAEFSLALHSVEAGGLAQVVSFKYLLDLDIPPGVPIIPTTSRCDGDLDPAHAGNACATDADCGGIAGACRAGLIYEDFESPGPSPTPTGGLSQNNDFSNTIGFIERNALTDSGTTVVGKACFGFMEVLGRTEAAGCRIDPDFDTDWHFEQSPGGAPLPKAFRGAKSAHWGRHTSSIRSGDTTPLREIEAFVTNPINLTPVPAAGDLFLSFFHIVSLADDNRIGFRVGEAGDRADVQISFDLDPGPTDTFSRWLKLEAFQNVYEHTTQVFSWFGYCEFTPTDAAKASNPNAFGETMCFPDGIWSHSGNVLGNNVTQIFQAQGPGHLGSSGDGVWVESRFSLSEYMGQRVRFRWIGQGWDFGNGWDSYLEAPGGGTPFDIGTHDDGWWVDAIRITGAIASPVTAIPDTTTIPLTGQCPATEADRCDESQGDGGFDVVFTLRDSDGDGGVVPGESLLLDASQTGNPGGCADGVPQYRFTRAPGDLLQDWSSAASLKLGNAVNGDVFQVQVRCSSDLSCTSSLTGPPVGAGACDPYLRVYTNPSGGPPTPPGPPSPPPPSSALAPNPPPFAVYSFDGCPGGAPICATLHSFLHSIRPDSGESCFFLPPSTYAHAFLATAALPSGAEAPGCAVGDYGLCAAAVFGPIPSAACSVPAANSCDVDSPPPPGIPPEPSGDGTITCGDPVAPPLGTIVYYYQAVATTGPCLSPDVDEPGIQDCYHYDGSFDPILDPACP